MFYARAICKRVNPAQFGDDDPSINSQGIGVFPNADPLPSITNTGNTVATQQAAAEYQAAQEKAAAQLVYAHDHPFSAWWSPSNPLGLPPGIGPQVDPNKINPWIKGAMILGGVTVGAYALGQVASITRSVRGR